MNVIELKWEGPVSFNRVAKGIGIPDAFNGSGIYIWTIQVNGRHVAYYVGETGRPVRDRTIEHYKCYVHGEYRIFDPINFREGVKKQPPMWGDAYGYRWPKRVDEYLRRFHELLPMMSEFVGLLEMFIIPFGEPARIRKRLEAEINYLCRSAEGDLQDDDIVYKPSLRNEEAVRIGWQQPIPVAGLEGLQRIDLSYRPPKRIG